MCIQTVFFVAYLHENNLILYDIRERYNLPLIPCKPSLFLGRQRTNCAKIRDLLSWNNEYC